MKWNESEGMCVLTIHRTKITNTETSEEKNVETFYLFFRHKDNKLTLFHVFCEERQKSKSFIRKLGSLLWLHWCERQFDVEKSTHTHKLYCSNGISHSRQVPIGPSVANKISGMIRAIIASLKFNLFRFHTLYQSVVQFIIIISMPSIQNSIRLNDVMIYDSTW